MKKARFLGNEPFFVCFALGLFQFDPIRLIGSDSRSFLALLRHISGKMLCTRITSGQRDDGA
jgi:hypothetical protein